MVVLLDRVPLRWAIGDPCLGHKISYYHKPAAFLLGARSATREQQGVKPRMQFVGFFDANCNGIHHARNKLIKQALTTQPKIDWLLMTDADTFSLAVDETLRMIADANVRDVAAVAAPVLMRNRPGYNAWHVVDGAERQLTREEFAGQKLSIRRIGAAYMAVNLGWLCRNWPWPEENVRVSCAGDAQAPWFDSPASTGQGEDSWFCDGVIARGGTLLLDGRLEPMHVDVNDPHTQRLRANERAASIAAAHQREGSAVPGQERSAVGDR